VTEYERALFRLKVWRALKGWGHTIPATGEDKLPESRPWNWDERLVYADLLAAWASKKEEE
jgi:hypothetical protein